MSPRQSNRVRAQFYAKSSITAGIYSPKSSLERMCGCTWLQTAGNYLSNVMTPKLCSEFSSQEVVYQVKGPGSVIIWVYPCIPGPKDSKEGEDNVQFLKST